MRFRKINHITIVVLLSGLILAAFLINGALVQKRYLNIHVSNRLVKNIPAGEIVVNTSIIQPVVLPDSATSDEMIGISILLATYNRNNVSQIEIALSQGDSINKEIVDTSSLSDNTYHTVLFDSSIYSSGPADIKITGIDGSHGNAITAWLTEDMISGQVIIDGAPIDYNLAYRIGTPVKNPAFDLTGGYVILWVWISTYMFVFILIALYIFQSRET